MYDLDVLDSETRCATVEVTGAVDPDATELWNLVNGRGRWIESDLRGGWGVTVKPTARKVRSTLPPFLRSLERAGPQGLGRDEAIADRPPGVISARQSDTDFPGSIYVDLDLPLEQTTGFVADDGDAVAAWIGDFLRDDSRADIRTKLARSGRDERHAFVIVGGLDALPPRLDSQLQFPALRGGYLNLHNWRRDEWTPAVRTAGLEHRTPYAMRHFFISEALAAGIPSYEVARLAGTSVIQIEATYAHLFGEHLERSRTALEAFDANSSEAFGRESGAAD